MDTLLQESRYQSIDDTIVQLFHLPGFCSYDSHRPRSIEILTTSTGDAGAKKAIWALASIGAGVGSNYVSVLPVMVIQVRLGRCNPALRGTAHRTLRTLA
jgi:hypothetical protein